MNKILILMAAITIPFASAVTSATTMPMKSMVMTKGMTNAMCMKKGGMVKMMGSKKMCEMKSGMMQKPSTMKK